MRKLATLLLALALTLGVCAVGASSEGASSEGAQTELTTVKIMGYEWQIADTFTFAERDRQAVWQAAEKLFTANGIQFEFEIVPDYEQYRTTIQTRLASDYNLPDMCYLGTLDEPDVLNLADMGIVLPMNRVLETTKSFAYNYFYNGEGNTARQMLSNDNGEFFWLPRIQMNMYDGEPHGTSMGVCIRLDWLRKLGLETPNSLDSFKAALQAFQDSDMNENGVKDEVALLDTSTFFNGINYWYGMVNDMVGVNVTDGKVESPWYSPHIKDYFRFIQGLVSDGLLYADAIGSDTSFAQLQNENKVSAFYYYPIGTYAEMPIRAAGYTDAYYIGIAPFDAVEGTTAFISEETPYLVYMKYGVTKAAADKLEAVAKVYDTIYSPDYINILDWGVEGKTYEVVDGQNKRLTIGMSAAMMGTQGIINYDAMCRYFFPSIYHNERLEEISRTEAGGWPEKGQYERDTASYSKITPNDNMGYYALSTPEEAAVLSECMTDLATYSRETAANLSLGRASLDDWDSYIAELKNLGLDRVLEVRQAQLDRRNAK